MPAQPKSTTGPRVLTVRELAGYLRVHQSTVYRLLRAGKLPAFKVGSDWRDSSGDTRRIARDLARFASKHIRSSGWLPRLKDAPQPQKRQRD
jgi:excisionase family DNA binding protein